MSKEKKKLTDHDLQMMHFRIKEDVQWENNEGIITIIREQNHWIQRFLRKLSFHIPEKTYLELDEYGSFVFQQIDGKQSVYDIGKKLGEKYEETNEFLYNRLLLYLNHLEINESLIERI